MALVKRDKASYAVIEKVIGKKTVYSSLRTNDRNKIINELLKTTQNFCPFTGDLSPYASNWTIEHFYFPQSEFPEKSLEWTNMIHCLALSNRPFNNHLNYPNVYSPEEVDYLEVLRLDFLNDSFQIKPIRENDQIAKNTIIRFDLNNPRLVNARKRWFQDRVKFEKTENFPFCEYFYQILAN